MNKLKWVLKRFDNLSPLQLYNILKLRYEVFNIEQQCIYQDIDDKDIFAYHLFLEEGDKTIAYLRIIDKGKAYEDTAIGRVLVSELYRRQGISREMLSLAIEFIEEKLHESRICISAQVYLVDFYKSLGFTVISEPYVEANIEHIKMLYVSKKD